MSAEHTSRFLIPFLRWLKPDISLEALALIQFVVRKCGHVTEYAILALLLFRAIFRRMDLQMKAILRLRSGQALSVSVWIACVLIAAADEFHQSFVESRTASPWDVMIDSAGAIFGLVISSGLARRRGSKKLEEATPTS